LTTFNVQSDCLALIANLRSFDSVVRPFKLTEKEVKLSLPAKEALEYKYLFELKAMKYINVILTESKDLYSFLKATTLLNNTEAIEWLNKVFCI
jgi:hypothetical protein